MTHRKISSCIAALLFLLQVPAQGQNEEGTFVHTIQRGETVYSIARTYQVSPDAILKLNPSANDGIKAGATLIIPQQGQRQGAAQEKYHTIQAGETLYQLTKKYGVGAADICEANPGLTADNFQIGKVIRIPLSAASAVAVSTPPEPAPKKQPECREMYKVKRKETLFSISRQFGISEAELQAANPEMKQPDYKLRRGDVICIPYPSQEKAEPVITPANPQTPSNAELMERKVSSPKRLIRMGVLLPFKGGSAESGKMIEFYRGVLMAVQQIKKTGVSVDVFAYDSGNTADEMKAVLEAHPLTELDLIIGPLHTEQIPTLSNYCQRHYIRLVVPFSSQGEGIYQNPYYYAVNPPKSFLLSEAAHLTTELFGKDNILLLDGNESDNDAANFSEAVNKRLMQNGNKMRTIRLSDDSQTWVDMMVAYKSNVIIPSSSSVKLLNQLFPKLRQFAVDHPEYGIKLVGYPEWQTYTNSHLENFYRFDTYAYSTFYRNPLNGRASQFENDYQKHFHETTITSWPRFGMLGYDTAYFFLKGLSTYGDALELHLGEVATTPYQHQFKFQRVSNWSGFINREVEFIHYSPAHSIEIINLKK